MSRLHCLRAVLVWCALVLLQAARAAAIDTPALPLKLSQDGSHLVDQSGRPFFINGDSAWSLIAELSKPDAELYLENRRQKGFNLIVVELIEHRFATRAPLNAYGEHPFIGRSYLSFLKRRYLSFFMRADFDQPNEAYFAHADWIIRAAAAKGIVVMLAPFYLGYDCGAEGWCGEIRNSSPDSIRQWGRYVGRRYRSFPNIIWLIGGDVDPVAAGVADKVEAFVLELRRADPDHLMTGHGSRHQAARAVWPRASWLDIDSVYADTLTYDAVVKESRRQPSKPSFLVEAYYENEHETTPVTLRSQAYWAVLSGGVLGHVFGNCPIWNFGAAVRFCSAAKGPWKTHLDSPGSTTLPLVGTLFRSRRFYALVPDYTHQVLTDGYEGGRTYAAAARTKDGATVIVFIPTRRPVAVEMSSISGTSAKAWWYNPRVGTSTELGTYPTKGTRTFTPADDNDWILVLDGASLSLPPPGVTAPLGFASR